MLTNARELLQALGRAPDLAVHSLCMGHLDLALARKAKEEGDLRGAVSRVEMARSRIAEVTQPPETSKSNTSHSVHNNHQVLFNLLLLTQALESTES
jgi:hypothetical protein